MDSIFYCNCNYSGAIDVTKVVKVIDEDALIVRHIWAMELLTRRCVEVRTLAAVGSFDRYILLP